MGKKITSKIFIKIFETIKNQNITEPFDVKNVLFILGPSKSFLSKHSIDPENPNKKIYGNPYFIRVSRGKYIINPDFKKL